MTTTARDIATEYIRRGIAVIPVPYKSKNPGFDGWQNLRITTESVTDHFNGHRQNIGGLMGAPSADLVDVDLDAPQAVRLAPRILPPTRFVFGRPSKRRSHWGYEVDPLVETEKFRDPTDGTMLVEIRSTGAQTILPGSTHPSGDVIEWDEDGEPSRISGPILRSQVALLGAASLLARRWLSEGSRHDAALALAGGLLRAGWERESVEAFIEAVALAAGDDEVEDRIDTVSYTATQLAAGGPATGWPTLAGIVGDSVVQCVRTWLDVDSPSVSSVSAAGDLPWSERKPLPAKLPSVPTLPAALIPLSLQPWLVDIADRAVVPLEYVAIPAIVGLGAVVGRSIGIRPSRFDDYLVVPNLWGAIIGRPGWMKSYAVHEPLKPLSRLAHEARERYTRESAKAEDRADRLKAEILGIKQAISTAAKNGKSAQELAVKLAAKKAEMRDCTVIERRYMTQDATVEKLGELLLQNPRGLLVMRDELAGWLRTLDKPGREGDREFFLEGWNGNAGYTFDRIGRGTIPIPAVTISIIGGIQPGKLRACIAGAMSEGSGADGLLQRLQLLVWPDGLGEWKSVNRWPDTAARNRAHAIFKALDDLQPSTIGAMTDDGSIPYLRFSDHAQLLHDDWKQALENRLRSSDLTSTPAFESHLSKYRSLMPSLALLFHLVAHAADGVNGPVSLDAARLAAAWCEYLELHARKVYHAELNRNADAVHQLAAKIEGGAIFDTMTVRHIERMQWTGLTTAATVRSGLESLVSLGWVRLETIATGGRPSEILRLHPALRSGIDG